MGQRPRPQEREEANGIFGLIAAQRVSIIGSDPKDVTGSVAYSRVRGTIPSTGSVASVATQRQQRFPLLGNGQSPFPLQAGERDRI